MFKIGHGLLWLDETALALAIGVFYKLVFMFYRGLSFRSVDFGLSLASVYFSLSHDARIAPSCKIDIYCVIVSKSPRANL